jgi:hypothetical protein
MSEEKDASEVLKTIRDRYALAMNCTELETEGNEIEILVAALDAGISSLGNTRHTEGKSDWISVEERLPEDGAHNLIQIVGEKYPCHAQFNDGEWVDDNLEIWNPGSSIGCVTHWMPLPEGPK